MKNIHQIYFELRFTTIALLPRKVVSTWNFGIYKRDIRYSFLIFRLEIRYYK